MKFVYFMIFVYFSLQFFQCTTSLSIELKRKIIQKLVLTENSTSFLNWLNPRGKTYRKYYLFEILNPDEISNGLKPYLRERGPYTYGELNEKRDVIFLSNNRISYSQVTTLLFEPSLSAGQETDYLLFLNIPALGMLSINQSGPFVVKTYNSVLKKNQVKLFVNKTVKDIISGYEDNLLKLGGKHNKNPNRKYGIEYKKNGTLGQNYVISSGVENINEIGQIETWNSVNKLNYWHNENANQINGSDGSLFPPFIDRKQHLYFYNTEICRSLDLEYYRDIRINKIRTYEFHLPKSIFFNSKLNSNNEGFCAADECLGDGIQSIVKCRNGLPVFASQPHFLNADLKFLQSVDGLYPNESKHDFVLNVEPITGLVIESKFRLQINFYLSRNKNYDLTKRIQSVLLPTYWVEKDVEVNSDTLESIINE